MKDSETQAQGRVECAKPIRKRKKCSHDDCENIAVKDGVCYKHGAERKKCSHDDCENIVVKDGVCYKHSAERRNYHMKGIAKLIPIVSESLSRIFCRSQDDYEYAQYVISDWDKSNGDISDTSGTPPLLPLLVSLYGIYDIFGLINTHLFSGRSYLVIKSKVYHMGIAFWKLAVIHILKLICWTPHSNQLTLLNLLLMF